MRKMKEVGENRLPSCNTHTGTTPLHQEGYAITCARKPEQNKSPLCQLNEKNQEEDQAAPRLFSCHVVAGKYLNCNHANPGLKHGAN